MKKVLLLPGWMRTLRLYKAHNDFDVRIGKLDDESVLADYVIGLSLGSLAVLQQVESIKGKIILINPPLPKKSILIWFVNWLKFIVTEGLFFERQKFTRNPIKFISALIVCVKLLNVDFSKTLDSIKGRLLIIRGRNDRFFCNDKTIKFLSAREIRIIEINGGHNWCEEIEKTINDLTKDTGSELLPK
ncbi:MAG: hypothetical protein WC705_01715 [Candidatus Paceibacterota bacterium]|jgi:hypothetical protein